MLLFSFRIRAQFGTDIKQNAVHGSSNEEHASKNIKLVFGDLEFTPDGRVKGRLSRLRQQLLLGGAELAVYITARYVVVMHRYHGYRKQNTGDVKVLSYHE